MDIRPISDLRNKYPEIEKSVLQDNEAIYLTKNGYGSMVVMSIEKYTNLVKHAEYNNYIETALDEVDKEADNPNTIYYTQEELIKKIRKDLNEQEI